MLVLLLVFVNVVVGDYEHELFFKSVHSSNVIDIIPGCGQKMNRIIIFADGTKVCCKYSSTKLQYRSELYYYYVSVSLGMHTVPPSITVTLDYSNEQWKEVSDKAKRVGWMNGQTVLLTQYIEGMMDEYLPYNIRLYGIHNVSNISREWSDMMVLDYITGHTDRLYCTLVNMQWAPSVIHKPVHNLGKTSHLVLYDNESCFTNGYKHNEIKQKFFVERLCYFNENTIQKLKEHVNKERNLMQESTELLNSQNRHITQLTPSTKQEFNRRSTFIVYQANRCNKL